jgi:hypothetical protein
VAKAVAQTSDLDFVKDMARVLICPAAGELPNQHLQKTIKNNVSLESIQDRISIDTKAQLEQLYPEGRLWIWGLRPGEGNDRTFEQLQAGDVACFFDSGGLRYAAPVTTKIDSVNLADHLWNRGPEGRPFSHIFFLGEPREVVGMSIDDWNATTGYRLNRAPQGTRLLDVRLSDRVLAAIALEQPTGTPAFSLLLGDAIERTVLHDEFGGRRQGGISPSRETPNVFLFSDPQTGRQHGYVDGWKDDGLFHYTGEGQHGDQEMKSGNAAIRDHFRQGRALRLFLGSGGRVTYDGRFELDKERPFYSTDAPETDNGPIRSVIVFRLKPIDAAGRAGPIGSSLPTELNVEEVPVEQQYTEQYTVNPQSEPVEADRREARLVNALKGFLETQKQLTVLRNRFRIPGEIKPCYTDLFVKELNLLVEAKGTTERGSVRMALGQLADYRRFLNRPVCAILLPSKPRKDLLELAATESVVVIWPVSDGYESTKSIW